MKPRGVDIPCEEVALINSCADRRRAGRQWRQNDTDFTLQFTVDVSTENFAIVGGRYNIPAIERMEMCGVTDQGDTVLFGAVSHIDADGIKAPLVVDDSNLEHAT